MAGDSRLVSVPSRVKTRQLELLAHLDEQRSILRAAEAAHMTQPAASKTLSDLEAMLAVPLFTRHVRGVEPTWYGEILIRHARNVLTDLRQAHEEIVALKTGLTGRASIGTAVTSATDLVPTAVAELKAKHPRILVNIETGFSETLIGRLTEGKLDIVIARIHSPDVLAKVKFEPFGEDPHGIFVRASHPLARRQRLQLNDLAQQTWVLPPPGNVLRDRIGLLFVEERMDLPKQVVETSSLLVIASLLKMSDMVAPLPTALMRPYRESRILSELRIRLDLRLGDAGIITRRDSELSPGAVAALGILRRVSARFYPR